MAHNILHIIIIELDEKMMQTFVFTNKNYTADFQESIFQCPKKTSRLISS